MLPYAAVVVIWPVAVEVCLAVGVAIATVFPSFGDANSHRHSSDWFQSKWGEYFKWFHRIVFVLLSTLSLFSIIITDWSNSNIQIKSKYVIIYIVDLSCFVLQGISWGNVKTFYRVFSFLSKWDRTSDEIILWRGL